MVRLAFNQSILKESILKCNCRNSLYYIKTNEKNHFFLLFNQSIRKVFFNVFVHRFVDVLFDIYIYIYRFGFFFAI